MALKSEKSNLGDKIKETTSRNVLTLRKLYEIINKGWKEINKQTQIR
jgi:uncharacterized protein YfbU (UPF0304 family)